MIDIKNQEYNTIEQELNNRFAPKKKYNSILSSIYYDLQNDLSISDSKINRVNNCGSLLGFVKIEDKFKLHDANFCRDRLCPMCGWRKSLRGYADLSRIMDYIWINPEYKGLKYGFLTLTCKNVNGDNLNNTIDILLNGYRKLTNKKRIFRSGVIAGTYRSLEITFNDKDFTFHPHIHVLIAFTSSYFTHGNYMSKKEWSKLWGDCIDSDYNPVIDIRMIKNYDYNNTINLSAEDVLYKQSMDKAINEVTKYVVKGSEFLDPDDLDKSKYITKVLYESLYHRRLIGYTGCFKKVQEVLNIEDVESADLIHIDDEFKINEEIVKNIIYYKWGENGYKIIA